MKLLPEGDSCITRITLFPNTLWPTSIPGPRVQFPMLVVHAERTEQQLLPVSGDRYDPRPYIAAVCLSCGTTLVVGRSDREETARRVQERLTNHVCQSSLIEGVEQEKYARIYRTLVSDIFEGFSAVRVLSYVCPCDTAFPNTHSGFSAHITKCTITVARLERR